jgi:hypothetical protein
MNVTTQFREPQVDSLDANLLIVWRLAVRRIIIHIGPGKSGFSAALKSELAVLALA